MSRRRVPTSSVVRVCLEGAQGVEEWPAVDASLAKAERGTRQVFFEGAWRETRVWSRLDLPADAVIEAPAVIEQPDATIFIEPGLRGRVDRLGNIVVERA